MRVLYLILKNYILVSAVVSWMLSQVIKTILTLISTKRFDTERIFGAGGMPSAHSAMVCALLMGIARKCGPSSPEFALAVAFAAVVMYDAMGVRRAAGEQAKILNKLVDKWEEDGTEITDKDLKEHLGHKPVEVLAGALLGILVSLAMA
ncbi:MAG TPA: divergent PAP2 family protein [Clostridia bacterium]|nr:divergent PAP2 family protein [Clostridia bacterium]